MDIIVLEKDFKITPQPLVAALGQFDGLHLAHQSLVVATVERARECGWKSALFTFDPHPDFILKKRSEDTYLTPLDQKTDILKTLGVDFLIVIKFDQDTANLSHKDFINKYLLPMGVREVVVGFDFRYGFKGAGNIETFASMLYPRLNIAMKSWDLPLFENFWPTEMSRK